MSPNEKKALLAFMVFYRDGVANETPGMGQVVAVACAITPCVTTWRATVTKSMSK